MYDDVKKDVKELLNILNCENANFRADLDKLGLDVEVMFSKTQEILSKYREKFHTKYFSFLDKYVNDKAFFASLDVEKNLLELIFTKFLISDEFYYGVLDQYYSSEEKLLSEGIVFDENDLQYFFNRGVSLKTIVEKYQLSLQVQETLCKDYPQFANQIISTNELLAPSIVATEISKGNYQPLEKYFDADYFSDYLLSLLKELGNLNQFDFDRVFDIIVDRNSKGDEFSVLNDDDLVKKLISIGGSKALIFANNPSAELVSLTEFSYSDYTLYDGAYKNSSALLLKFLKEGKLDALKYAKSGAITEEVIQIINQNNISLETLKLYSNLDNSPFFS